MKPIVELILLVIFTLVVLSRAHWLYEQSLESMYVHGETLENDGILKAMEREKTEEGQLGDTNDNMMHFMHVSDIHVSKYRDHGCLAHLRHFLVNEMQLVGPELVVATGDLTDAKAHNRLTSLQHREEWIAYHELLQDSGVLNKKNGNFWFDQRGNHDCFNVPSFKSTENMFRLFAVVGTEGYAFHLQKPFGLYSFIALDGCPVAGSTRPFNFFAYMDSGDMDFLAREMKAAANHTFVMSHYPTTNTVFGHTSSGLSFQQMSHRISVWLSGHLHKLLAGLGDKMYAYQDSFLELELGDVKYNGMYRIVIVDNDLVSFRDLPIFTKHPLPLPVSLSDDDITLETESAKLRPPIVLITNPKDARFILTGKEPTHRIINSTHIRVVCWSEYPVVSISMFIDGVEIDTSGLRFVGYGKRWVRSDDDAPHLPLWVNPWDASLYNDDLTHELVVVAKCSSGASSSHKIPFRVDGKRLDDMESGTGGFILSIPFPLLLKDLYVLSFVLTSFLCLLLPKLFVLTLMHRKSYNRWAASTSKHLIMQDKSSRLYLDGKSNRIADNLNHRFEDFTFTVRATFFRFCKLSKVWYLFYPIYGSCLFTLIGPWFVGEFVPNAGEESGRQIGWMMTYGIWFNDGTWVPVLDSWVFSFYGFGYAVFPLVFYLSFCSTAPALLYCKLNPRLTKPIHSRWYIQGLVALVALYHIVDSLSLGIFYGTIAILLSPMKLWFSIWASFVLYTHCPGLSEVKHKST